MGASQKPLPTASNNGLGLSTFESKVVHRPGSSLCLQPGSRNELKIAFRTRFGHFEYLVMPFGLTAVFQHMINDILHEFLGRFMVAYLDDILIYSETKQEHEAHIRMVLKTLRKHKLYCKLEICQFFETSITYQGFNILPKVISMDHSGTLRRQSRQSSSLMSKKSSTLKFSSPNTSAMKSNEIKRSCLAQYSAGS